uniref:RRM domain-containing protein n=1 Tax=Ciona intestinalis TaxID=7719 RepID=F6Y5H7_CIOIN
PKRSNGPNHTNGTNGSSQPNATTEPNGAGGTNGAQTNLIVNYLPQTLSDQEFYQLFNNVGAVTSARIIRDKQSGYSFGYGFVDYVKPEDADKAIQQLNGHPIQHKTIKVAFSKPAGADSKNINLYVAGLNPDTSEESLKQRFSSYGTIIQTRVLKDKNTNLCSGIGFVLFNTKDEAMAAIKALNGAVFSQASTSPLVVKFAKTDQKVPDSFQGGNYQGKTGGGPMRGRGLKGIRGRYSPMSGRGFVSIFSISYYWYNAEGRIVYVYGIGPYTDENALWHLFFNFGTI